MGLVFFDVNGFVNLRRGLLLLVEDEEEGVDSIKTHMYVNIISNERLQKQRQGRGGGGGGGTKSKRKGERKRKRKEIHLDPPKKTK